MFRIFRCSGSGAVALALSFAIVGEVSASMLEKQGEEIARLADLRDSGWGDIAVSMKMTLKTSQQDQSIRELRTKLIEQPNDGDKSLIIFDEPADVRGTVLLSYGHKLGPDDQWLYLPALKRVKRISADNRAGPFMGSEFAYEDLSPQEVEKYKYKYLRDERLGEHECFVVERYPVDDKSGYTRQVVWWDKTHHRLHKVEFFDRKNVRMKTLTFSDYKQYMNKYWRALKLEMENHITGKSTMLQFADYRFSTGMGDSEFNPSRLRNQR